MSGLFDNSPIDEPFVRGMRDFQADVGVDDNPYPATTPEWSRWFDGWRWADDEAWDAAWSRADGH